MQWKRSGATDDDIIDRLRARTVPRGYPIHSWSQELGTIAIDNHKYIILVYSILHNNNHKLTQF